MTTALCPTRQQRSSVHGDFHETTPERIGCLRCNLELQRHRNWTPHCVWMGCHDVSGVGRLQNHIRSWFAPGVAVPVSSQVLQATPHIVGLIALCTATQTHWLLKKQTHSLLNCRRDSGHICGVDRVCRPPSPGTQDHNSNCPN